MLFSWQAQAIKRIELFSVLLNVEDIKNFNLEVADIYIYIFLRFVEQKIYNYILSSKQTSLNWQCCLAAEICKKLSTMRQKFKYTFLALNIFQNHF